MGRSAHSARFPGGAPGGGLLGILFLVLVMAGVPVLFKEARDCARAVSMIITDQITPRL
jgi:hypothetical protein